MKKIIKNAIKCNHCGETIISIHRHDFGETIISIHRHDFVACKCGSCSVDGGNDYLRRGFTNSQDDFIELSEYEETYTC